MVKRIIARTIIGFLLTSSILILGQAIVFICILSNRLPLEHADSIVVFQGSRERVSKAYELAAGGVATQLIVSPATRRQLKNYERIYNSGKKIDALIEDKARTTFENALFTSRILKNEQFGSTILVSSWNHMPRSCLLLKLMLKGSDIRILPYPVATGKLNAGNWYRTKVGWKMVYNELIESWGSVVEWVRFVIRGAVPNTQPGKTAFFSRLKRWLLFDIDQRAMAL